MIIGRPGPLSYPEKESPLHCTENGAAIVSVQKVNVKFALEELMKFQSGSKGTALLFL